MGVDGSSAATVGVMTTTPQQEHERDLEAFFHKKVREMTGGMLVKIAPTTAGVPDRLVLMYGRLHLVELKVVGRTLSPIQQVWHHRVRQIGIPIHTLHGRGEIMAWIRKRAAEADGSVKKTEEARRRKALEQAKRAKCCVGCTGEDCQAELARAAVR